MKLREYIPTLIESILDWICRYKEIETSNGVELYRRGHKVFCLYQKSHIPQEKLMVRSLKTLWKIEEAERSSLIKFKVGLRSFHNGKYDLFELIEKKSVGHG